MSTHEAIVQINHSELQPQTKLNAFQLLEQVDPNSGHITLTREELCALFDVGSDGAARRHLGRMQAAGIIHYSTNAAVYINFRVWIDPRLRVGARLADHPRAASGSSTYDAGAAGDPTCAPTRGQRITHARPAARGRADTPPDPPRVSERSSSYQPDEDSIIQSLTDDQQLALACLTSDEVQLSRRKATQLAATYSLNEIRAACLRFIDDERQPRKEAGLVAHWLEFSETLPAIGERHRAGDWWQRHRTQAEIGADEEQEQALEAQAAQFDAEQAQAEAAHQGRQEQLTAAWRRDFPHTLDLADLWSAVVDSVLACIPADVWRAYLGNTAPVSYQARTLTIAAATTADAELINHRLRARITSALAQYNAVPQEILFISQQESRL